MTARIGVAFTVREKFGWALASLQRIYRVADMPFTLYFVDCGYPLEVLNEIERFLSDKQNVVRVRTAEFIWPSAALNLIIPKLQEQYLCVIQNDVMVEPGYFRELLGTFERHGCDIAQPDTQEWQDGRTRPHRHEFTDTRIAKRDGRWFVHVPIANLPKEKPQERWIQHFELHTLMFNRRAIERVFPLPVLNTREHIDLAMRAFHDDLVAFINDRARASYVLPPIQASDVAYFDFRWNLTAAQAAHDEVGQRWDIANMPNSMGFIAGHRKFLLPEMIKPGPARCEIDVL